MKIKKVLPIGIFLPFLAIFIVSACKHDPLTPLNEAPVISFQTDVQPILISNCTQSGCHGKQDHEFALTTYTEIMRHVEAGEPHKSNLYSSITANAFNRMPQPPNPRLSDTQIKTIYLWILQGAKNN